MVVFDGWGIRLRPSSFVTVIRFGTPLRVAILLPPLYAHLSKLMIIRMHFEPVPLLHVTSFQLHLALLHTESMPYSHVILTGMIQLAIISSMQFQSVHEKHRGIRSDVRSI